MANLKEVTGRDGYILVEALTFTIEAPSALPFEFRPDNNITDMKRILDELMEKRLHGCGSKRHNAELRQERLEHCLKHSL